MQVKRRTAKKEVCLGEKKKLVMRYNSQGLKRDVTLQIVGVFKHQYYYISKKTKQGMRTSTTTSKDDGTEVDNREIVSKIKELKGD